MKTSHRSGFVSILGRPNAGKSTLLNALVGQKVAIVADKPQTTRTSIQGVLTLPDAQIVFIDTPGIHKADSSLNKRLMQTVRASLEERDLLLFIADASRPFTPDDRKALDLARKPEAPMVLVLNKVDLIKDKAALLPLIEEYKAACAEFKEYVPISAARKSGLEDLQATILKYLPEGPAYFPEDYVTDQPERFLAAELIREKVLRTTRQEVPHSVAVAIDQWEQTE
jgi:GTP-binding protein Era